MEEKEMEIRYKGPILMDSIPSRIISLSVHHEEFNFDTTGIELPNCLRCFRGEGSGCTKVWKMGFYKQCLTIEERTEFVEKHERMARECDDFKKRAECLEEMYLWKRILDGEPKVNAGVWGRVESYITKIGAASYLLERQQDAQYRYVSGNAFGMGGLREELSAVAGPLHGNVVTEDELKKLLPLLLQGVAILPQV